MRRIFVCALALIAGIGCGGSSSDSNDQDSSVDQDGAPQDTGATGTLGQLCDKAGALACNGKAQKLQLLCDGSKWIANGTCPGQQVCDPRPGPTQGSCQDPAPGCGDKTPGTGFCDGAIRHVCSDDLLTETSTTCKSAAFCAAGSGSECATCVDGDSTCDGPSLKVCAPDHLSFIAKETCATSALCVPGESKCRDPACAIGDYQCAGDVLQTCNDGRTGWNDAKHCGAGLCDATSKSCLDCAPGSKQCSGATPQTCDSTGHWSSGSPCSGSTPVCTAGVCAAGVCSSGDYRCSGDTLQSCNASSTGWDDVTTCGAGLCDASAKACRVCAAGALACSGTTPESCDSSGHWVLGTPCSGSTPTCSSGTCVATVVTTVTFPSTTSTTHDGAGGGDAPLGAGGGGKFFVSGSYVEETFPRTAPITRLDLNFKMSSLLSGCAAGSAVHFNVEVNGTVVGTYYFSGTGDVPVTESYTFAAITPSSGNVTLRYETTDTVCSGGSSWNWYAGGTATMQ
jgi:hypothetical protein